MMLVGSLENWIRRAIGTETQTWTSDSGSTTRTTKGKRVAICELLFTEGMMAAKKDDHVPKCPELANSVPNFMSGRPCSLPGGRVVWRNICGDNFTLPVKVPSDYFYPSCSCWLVVSWPGCPVHLQESNIYQVSSPWRPVESVRMVGSMATVCIQKFENIYSVYHITQVYNYLPSSLLVIFVISWNNRNGLRWCALTRWTAEMW